MCEKKVIRLLADDMAKIELPPISEQVRQAIREKKQQYEALNSTDLSVHPTQSHIPMRIIFAAMLTFMAVSVPVILILNHGTYSPDNSSLPAPSSTHSNHPLPSADNSKTLSAADSHPSGQSDSDPTLDQIRMKQVYGTAALSGRSEQELETLLTTYTVKNTVYEDDRYLYNFDTNGHLLEIISKTSDMKSDPAMTQEMILDQSKALLQEYFPDWQENKYDCEFSEDRDCFPVWSVTFSRKPDELTKQRIVMTFDPAGKLHWLCLDGTTESIGKLSVREATEIALQESRKDIYDLPDFREEEVDIIVTTRMDNQTPYYNVIIDKIPTVKDSLPEAVFLRE